MQLDEALKVLADPAKREEHELEAAASVVNQAIAAGGVEIAALEANWGRDSLDLVVREDHEGAAARAREIREKKERLEHLRHAGKEANRRMGVALGQAEAAEEREAWTKVSALMKEREDATRKLVEHASELGELYKRIAVLADQIWDACPRKPAQVQFIDFFDADSMQKGVDWLLDHTSGWALGQPRLGEHSVPDLVAACRSGHREMLNKKPLDGLRQGVEIDEAEWERRTQRAAQRAA